jgi:pyruvate dehydrogenase E1 component alpha subunit
LEDRIAARSQRLRADLREAVFAAPDIDVDEVFTTVYAEMTPGLEAQRRQLRDEIAREA